MSNLSSFSTINEIVNKYKVDYEQDSLGLAFDWFSLETILKLNEDEIEDSITDGAMDGAIDAIYISNKVVHIFNFKYANTFENSKNNFPETEVDKLLVTVEGIFNKTINANDVNELLWEKIQEIWELFDKGRLNFKFYLCSNKNKPIAHAIRKFETGLSKYRFVEFYYIDQEDLISKIIEKKYREVNGQIRFVDKQYFDRSDGPLKGIVATVAVIDLINLIKSPDNPNEIIDDVFNENVRVYLNLKNRINQSIFDTAISEDNFIFWYLNNGITILCDECIYTPNSRSPVVELKNLQIVNGGQTTHALFEAYLKDAERIKDVLVLVRICETKKDYRIGEKISESTNSQTPIRTRDLHSNDRIQRKLEEQFVTLGYHYERKKNQYQHFPKSKRLDNELLGQIYLAYHLDMPSEAKNQKQLIFSDKYDDIFDENQITAQKMLEAFKVFLPLEKMKKEIQQKKRKKLIINEKDAFVSRATFHLLNVVKIIKSHENIDLSNQKNIDYAISKAIKLVKKIVDSESKRRGSLYTHDKFFKEVAANKIIRDSIIKQLGLT